jgi:phosphomannomutase
MMRSFACQARRLLRRRLAFGDVTYAPLSIFKAYDVRGLYGDEIDGDVAYDVGRAFIRVLGGADPRVGLGRDMRLTAPELAARYRDGMVAEGAHVLDAGQVGTEMLYWLVGSKELDGGLMCKASHNPKAYTGAKLVERGAVALSGDSGIGEIRDMVEAGLGDAGGPAKSGTHEEVEIYEDFQRAALQFIDPGAVKPLKVVVDGGNGMAGPMVGPLLEQLGLDLVTTYWEPDGEFPDHEPNPLLEENRRFIIDKVRAEQADLGIAWDGDADRCFFIDDTGAFVDGDFMTALLAESILEKQPRADILYDVRASRAVPDLVSKLGGRAHVNRVGHAFFKRRMRDEGGDFGGEVSGHYYFRDFYNADSGTIPALLILELLSKHEAKLSELLAPLREHYFISGEINSEVADTGAKMAEIERRYSDGEITKLDGISIDYPDWHFNVRPSNTEPLLRLNLESLVSAQDMERRRDEVLDLIRS